MYAIYLKISDRGATVGMARNLELACQLAANLRRILVCSNIEADVSTPWFTGDAGALTVDRYCTKCGKKVLLESVLLSGFCPHCMRAL